MRIQAFSPGLDVEPALATALEVDDGLENELDWDSFRFAGRVGHDFVAPPSATRWPAGYGPWCGATFGFTIRLKKNRVVVKGTGIMVTAPRL